MRRARHPLPYSLMGIRFDPSKERYFIPEAGITYYLTIEHTRLLKEFYRKHEHEKPSPTIRGWYDSLDRITKKEIEADGMGENEDEYFYPDSFRD